LATGSQSTANRTKNGRNYRLDCDKLPPKWMQFSSNSVS